MAIIVMVVMFAAMLPDFNFEKYKELIITTVAVVVIVIALEHLDSIT